MDGFANSFTAGEICDDAWDRVDIQPTQKGCEQAVNLMVRVAGPLGKRRGFWRLGGAISPLHKSRFVPFRRAVTDALMLEFGHFSVRVWSAGGALTGVAFASPYSADDAQTLRWRQVADVIYLRTSAGLPPRTLTRHADDAWVFAVESFPNGPWLAENVNVASTITLTGAEELDTNAATGAGAILPGTAVDLIATADIFDPRQVGGYFRTRAGPGAGTLSWSPGTNYAGGNYVLSAGHMYAVSGVGTHKTGSNPPVQLAGSQSDGDNVFDYRHDGAGVIQILGVTDARHANGVTIAAHPLPSGVATFYWAEGAWSDYRGWPRMWPALREERLAEGGTARNLDTLDLTEDAGFYPDHESFSPGTGFDLVLETDAVRKRVGDDGGELIWAAVATYLVVGSNSGEYLVSGNLVDDPLTPASATLKPISGFGSADAAPVKAHKGLLYITLGGQTVRELVVDAGQNVSTDDLTVLATHIGARGFAQLAWVKQPDNVLWARLADGGLAAFTYHQEQQVKGWTRQALGGGFVVEDMAVLPGPGLMETLWLLVSRVRNNVPERAVWQLSQASDGLFLDGALLYAGAPVAEVAGLDAYEGESLRALADGAQVDGLVVAGGTVTLPTAASRILVGYPTPIAFRSLPLSAGMNERRRVTGAIVSMKCAAAIVGLQGSGTAELVSTRLPGDSAAAVSRRTIANVTLAGDGGQGGRDPRIEVSEDSAYDFVLYSIKPKLAPGG